MLTYIVCKEKSTSCFVYSQEITDKALQKLCESCPSLIYFCISGCIRLNDATLVALGNNCPELTTLEAAGCSQFTDAGFKILAQVGDSSNNNILSCQIWWEVPFFNPTCTYTYLTQQQKTRTICNYLYMLSQPSCMFACSSRPQTVASE